MLASERGNYPVVFFGLRWLMELGGLPSSGEGWLRLPFAFFGILCVPMLALVGDLLVGRRTALLAAALLAVHPWHLEISQSARGVGVALFFACSAPASLPSRCAPAICVRGWSGSLCCCSRRAATPRPHCSGW